MLENRPDDALGSLVETEETEEIEETEEAEETVQTVFFWSYCSLLNPDIYHSFTLRYLKYKIEEA